MKKNASPNPLERRHVLSEDLDRMRALAIAEAYMLQGRVLDSIAFFDKAKEPSRLESILLDSVEEGDAFLFRAVCELLGRESTSAQWRKLASTAETKGKLMYSAEATRQLQRLEN